MMSPLASSLPDTGRKRTEMSASENFLSSKTATAHGWVSSVCASTWRFSEGRRTHCPATNFHFGSSAPRSYFIVVLSPAAAANVAVDTNASSASTRFICEVLFACSIQALGHNLPVVALDQCHLGDGPAGLQARRRDHGPALALTAAAVASASERFARVIAAFWLWAAARTPPSAMVSTLLTLPVL